MAKAGTENIKNFVVKSFLTGLSVLIPLYLTIYVIDLIVSSFDRFVNILPAAWRPPEELSLPGLGLLLAFVVATAVGVVVRNMVGKTILAAIERLIGRVPVVAGIYNLLRQVSEAMLGEGAKSFSRVVLVEWPRRDCWTIAFVTAQTPETLTRAIARGGEPKKVINLFVPTTPNPTSGFYFMVPEAEVIDIPITVEQAFKAIISAGSFPAEGSPTLVEQNIKA